MRTAALRMSSSVGATPGSYGYAAGHGAGLHDPRGAAVKIVVSPEAADLIRHCGGDLYVWAGRLRGELSCCAGAAPPGKEWRRHSRPELDLFVETGLKVPGAGIEVTLSRFPTKRLMAAPLR